VLVVARALNDWRERRRKDDALTVANRPAKIAVIVAQVEALFTRSTTAKDIASVIGNIRYTSIASISSSFSFDFIGKIKKIKKNKSEGARHDLPRLSSDDNAFTAQSALLRMLAVESRP
jgi:hypothetical protein